MFFRNPADFPSQSGSNPMVASATNTQGHSLSFAGTNLWRCDAHVIDVCDLNCLDVDPKNGCPFCIQSCRTYCHYVRLLLSCQARVTVTSCFVYKFIRDL